MVNITRHRSDALAKSPGEAPRWLSKKFDIQGVVFLTGLRPYMRYAEGLFKTYNAVDRTFCDAIRSIILVTAVMLMLAVTWPEVALSGDPSLTTAPAADLSETKTLISAIFKVVSSLIVVVALMLGFVYLMKKSGINKGLQSGSMVKVLETKMVAPKKYIAIVEVAGKTLSIGVTDHNINLLTELDSDTVKQLQAASGETDSPRVTNKFAALLAKATSKKEV